MISIAIAFVFLLCSLICQCFRTVIKVFIVQSFRHMSQNDMGLKDARCGLRLHFPIAFVPSLREKIGSFKRKMRREARFGHVTTTSCESFKRMITIDRMTTKKLIAILCKH